MRWKRVSAIHHHLKKKTGCAHTNKHLGKLGVVRSLGDKHLHLFFDTHAMGCLVFSTVDLLADLFHIPFCFRLDAITNRLCKNTKSDMILSILLTWILCLLRFHSTMGSYKSVSNTDSNWILLCRSTERVTSHVFRNMPISQWMIMYNKGIVHQFTFIA